MPDKIAVAILNWNGVDLLKRFLPSITRYSGDAEIYVIDNASSDASLSFLAEHYPQVRCIPISRNLGYAGGYNQGLKQIEEPLVVLLNSDVEVSPNWLEPIVQRFDADPDLAALQPKIKDLKNPDYFEYAGACGGFVDRLGYPFCRGRVFDKLEKDEGQYDTFRPVFWATGACLIVRKSAYWQAGGLNEMLFAHMEEIDLCWRMQLHGFTIACEPASQVYHLGGATLKISPRKTYLNFRNSLIILFLNLPHLEAMRKIFSRLVLDGIAALKFLLEGQPRHFLAVLQAHFSFYARFNSLFRQKIGKPVKPLLSLEGVYKKRVVARFYLRGEKTFSDIYRD